jgi:hypothetical protein
MVSLAPAARSLFSTGVAPSDQAHARAPGDRRAKIAAAAAPIILSPIILRQDCNHSSIQRAGTGAGASIERDTPSHARRRRATGVARAHPAGVTLADSARAASAKRSSDPAFACFRRSIFLRLKFAKSAHICAAAARLKPEARRHRIHHSVQALRSF